MSELLPEPWLRGPVPDLHPVLSHLLRASQQIREDIERAILPLTQTQLWGMPQELNPAGFHAKHLAGSTGRLSTYLEGRTLTPQQLAAIPRERAGSESASELIAAIHNSLDHYERLVRVLQPEEFAAIRHVGRQRLPVTTISLAIHIVEHGQRHTGQAITAAKLARALYA